jgi:hypothetical protein
MRSKAFNFTFALETQRAIDSATCYLWALARELPIRDSANCSINHSSVFSTKTSTFLFRNVLHLLEGQIAQRGKICKEAILQCEVKLLLTFFSTLMLFGIHLNIHAILAIRVALMVGLEYIELCLKLTVI